MKLIMPAAAATLLLFAASGAQASSECGDLTGPGTTDGFVEGTAFCEYVIEGRTGQKLSVNLESGGIPMEAFIYEPISESLPDGEAVTLPEDAVYTIRVGMTRAVAAKEEGKVQFVIDIALEGKGKPEAKVENSAEPAPTAVIETGGEDKPEGYVGGTDVATLKLDGIWEGVIPCGSCPGIEVYLNLDRDGTYTRTQVYREEKDGTFQDSGDWFQQGKVIVLASSDEKEEDTFLVRGGDGELLYSDDAGAPSGADYRLKRTGH